jgi:hypothetical protein
MFKRVGWSVIGASVCFIPLWLYLLATWVFRPSGFWQNFILAGAGLYFLGSFQFLGIVVFIFWMIAVWKKS